MREIDRERVVVGDRERKRVRETSSRRGKGKQSVCTHGNIHFAYASPALSSPPTPTSPPSSW